MVVVNMAKWPSDFQEDRMYCCPAEENGFDASYRHYPAKYIANYISKGARYIAVIGACVRLNKSSPDEVLWKFSEIADVEAIDRAEAVRAKTRRNPRPCLVFLQVELSSTDFQYDHDGGFQSSRTYFDVSELEPTGVKDLAAKLRQVPWSVLPKWRPG